MTDPTSFLVFFLAAGLLAVTPGPGLAYVAARALAGGVREGVASSFGTALGGSVHIAAGALGVSALVLASAEAFTALKIVGAAYLVVLGLRTIREASATRPPEARATGAARAFREGVVVEALNPKTAAFFLAFLPQFISPAGNVALQFVTLGAVCVALNTAADLVVAVAAGRVRRGWAEKPLRVVRLRQGSGALMCGLGGLLLLARRPA